MTNFRTFQSGQTLSADERAQLSPEDRKRYDLEQKVKGLMKLADNPGATDDERDTATRMIAKLITKHQIDLALLREEARASRPVEIVSFEVYVSNRFGMGNVRAQAITSAVVEPLGGKVVWWHSASDSTKIDTKLLIFLPEDAADFAKLLIPSLLLQVETSLKVATVQHKRDLDMDWRLTRNEVTRLMALFRKGYLLSWGRTVGARIRAGREEAREEASRETGKEIALLDYSQRSEAAMDAWREDRGLKIRKARKVLFSADGASAGRRDGARARLGTNEVGGSRTALRA